MAMVLIYGTFSVFFMGIIVAGSMEELVLYVAPVIGLLGLAAAMYVRMVVHGNRREVIGTAVRYGVISFGVAGWLVMLWGLLTPGYVRHAERFHRQMRREADIPAIRAWAKAFKVPPGATPTISGCGVFVPREKWPESIRKLGPVGVHYYLDTECVYLVFGGGFGHWGLSVGPKGTPPDGGYSIPLEDGAWVWHEIQ